MCGRFVQLPLQFPSFNPFPDLSDALEAITARYNLAPTQRAAVVLDEAGQRKVERLRWGLIPPWAKDTKGSYSTINARIETVSTKPAYRHAWKAHRCVIPMAGYYEWVEEGGAKQPYYLTRADGHDLWAAGLWEPRHAAQDDESAGSCTIITVDAEDAAGRVHDRMPVFLAEDAVDEYLRAVPDEAMRILLAQAVPPLEVRRVSRRVNSTRNMADDSTLIEPEPLQ